MIRLTTRGIRTAEAIRDRVPFTTSGSLKAEAYPEGNRYAYEGRLNNVECEVFRTDRFAGVVDYIVFSYATPIAWHRSDGTWHIVAQRFSLTTTKHQGNLYLTECTCSTKHGTGGWSDVTGDGDPACPVHKVSIVASTGRVAQTLRVVKAAESGQVLVLDEFNVAGA